MTQKGTHPQKTIPEHEPDSMDFGQQFESEIGAQSRRLFDKIMDYWRVIAASVAVFILLVSAFAGYNSYQEHRLTKSEQALDQALLENQGLQKLAALQEIEDQMAKPFLPRHHLETAMAAQNVQDWTIALAYWNKLANIAPENWNTTARLGKATALLRLDQTDQAVAELESLRASASEEYMPLVLMQLATAAEAAGNWDKALNAYEELKELGAGQQVGFLDFKMTQVRQKLADPSS